MSAKYSLSGKKNPCASRMCTAFLWRAVARGEQRAGLVLEQGGGAAQGARRRARTDPRFAIGESKTGTLWAGGGGGRGPAPPRPPPPPHCRSLRHHRQSRHHPPTPPPSRIQTHHHPPARPCRSQTRQPPPASQRNAQAWPLQERAQVQRRMLRGRKGAQVRARVACRGPPRRTFSRHPCASWSASDCQASPPCRTTFCATAAVRRAARR